MNSVLTALLTAVVAGCGATAAIAQEDIPAQADLHSRYSEHIRPLLENYCIRCHDQNTESNVRLDTLNPDIAATTIDTWTRVKNMLDVGSMPPKGKKQPNSDELDVLLAWIGGSLKRYDADHKETGGDTLIRRINNRAYANMIKTLLGVPAQGTEAFPKDGQVRGFDTVGAGLYITTSLYELYWKSAQQTLDIAIPDSESQPEIKSATLNFKAQNSETAKLEQYRECLKKELKKLRDDPTHYDISSIQKFLNRLSIQAPLRKMMSTSFVEDAVSAFYGEKTIKTVTEKGIIWANDPKCIAALISAIEAQEKQIKEVLEPYVSDFQAVTLSLTGLLPELWLNSRHPGYYIISARLCIRNNKYPLPVGFYVNDHIVRSFMLCDPESAPQTYVAKVFCGGSEKFSIHAAFPTAIYTAKYRWFHYITNYLIALYGLSEGQAQEMADRFNQFHVSTENSGDRGNEAKGADILCSEFSVRGPIYDSWPPPAAARIFSRGMKAPPSRENVEEIVKAFMKRAYVRGDCDAEMARPYVDLIMSHYETEKNFVKAVKFGLTAILSSPRFLYLGEKQRTESSQRKPLTAFELARRLAYFLWSDLPDDALMSSAASGALLDDKELTAQTQRMLKDERSHAFRESFTLQWLKIDKLEDISFSLDLLPAFHIFLLQSAKEESVAFFSEILDKNLSVMNFIDSDFTLLNGCLAQHYGIPGIVGNEFRRVQLPPGSHRGGVLTQASVLMATSNGMASSLVRRGAFVMERLLDVPPGRPPPNVPALDKIKVTKDDGSPFTPRERMAMHRENMSCARCHDKIDPLGVGLENFNALGSWNAKLRLLLPMPDKKTNARWVERDADVHGAMLDGTAYNGPDELRQQLLKQKDQFASCLAENMMIYALGRDLELSDKPVLDGICARVEADKYGLATLVEQVVLSDLFRNK